MQEQRSDMFAVERDFLENLQVSPFEAGTFLLQMDGKKPGKRRIASKIVGKDLAVGLVQNSRDDVFFCRECR